jgi:hypothetical protein
VGCRGTYGCGARRAGGGLKKSGGGGRTSICPSKLESEGERVDGSRDPVGGTNGVSPPPPPLD